MRHRVSAALFVLACAAAACSDSGPVTAPLTPFRGGLARGLTEAIQQQIFDYLPRGFESSVDARWSTVQAKKAADDFAGARKELNTLTIWIKRKQAEITPPEGMSQDVAAVTIVSNMAVWLAAPPGEEDQAQEIVLPPDADVAFDVNPAGAALELKTKESRARVRWSATANQTDRIVIITQDPGPGNSNMVNHVEDPGTFTGVCNGPLPTSRCQYPLFYKVESFPDTPLTEPGQFAACMLVSEGRVPLDAEGSTTVHERLRLAHNKPDDPNNAVGTIEGDIEILPLAEVQDPAAIDCEAHSHASMNSIQQGLHAVMHFAERILTPKSAWAFDSGPEHDFLDFSNFNAVDPSSQPDLAATNFVAPESGFGTDTVTVTFDVSNTSPRLGGGATAAAGPTSVGIYLLAAESDDIVMGPLVQAPAPAAAPEVAFMRPDAVAQSFSISVVLPHEGIALDASYRIAAVVDETGEFGEVTTGNNVASAAFLLRKKKADLTAPEGFTLTSATSVPGGSLTTSPITVENDGNATSLATTAQFMLMPGATALGSAIPLASIVFGNHAVIPSQTLRLPNGLAPGSYNLELVIDGAGTVEELDESNNTVSRAFDVAGIAIYRNYAAWTNDDEAALQGAPFNYVSGVQYQIRPMSGLASGIPAGTDYIIIPAADKGDLESQITQQRAGADNLAAWVSAGGTLIIQAGDNSPSEFGYIVPGLSGPVDDRLNCDGLSLAVADHAIVRGPDGVLSTDDDLNDTVIDQQAGFCYDNHGSLTGLLPGSATVLITEQLLVGEESMLRPVYATYALGAGRVIVNTLTIGYAGQNTRTLVNHFYFALDGLTAPPPLLALAQFQMAKSVAEPLLNSDGSPRVQP